MLFRSPCEYALFLFKREQNDIIKSQLRLIILDLNSKIYTRCPTFYANLIDIEEYSVEEINELNFHNILLKII